MRKIILISLLFIQFFVTTQASAACNLSKFSFGSSMQAIEKKMKAMNAINLPATSGFIETDERHTIAFQGEELCKGDKTFLGSPIDLTFIENTLVEIRLFKFIEYGEKPELVNWAESVYGEKTNKPNTFYQERPSAFWMWDGSNSTVSYSLIDIGYGLDEVIIIQSDKHSDLFEKDSEKEDGI